MLRAWWLRKGRDPGAGICANSTFPPNDVLMFEEIARSVSKDGDDPFIILLF